VRYISRCDDIRPDHRRKVGDNIPERRYTLKQLYQLREEFQELGIPFKDILDRMLFASDEEGNIFPLMTNEGRVPVTLDARKSAFKCLKKKCTNAAGAGGAQGITIQPAKDSIVKLMWVAQRNSDTVARSLQARIRTSGNEEFGTLYYKNDVGATAYLVWPHVDSTNISWFSAVGAVPFVLTEDFALLLHASGIAVSEDTDFFLLYEVIGDDPTIAYINPAGATWSDIS
jgi:hypothetical protein